MSGVKLNDCFSWVKQIGLFRGILKSTGINNQETLYTSSDANSVLTYLWTPTLPKMADNKVTEVNKILKVDNDIAEVLSKMTTTQLNLMPSLSMQESVCKWEGNLLF